MGCCPRRHGLRLLVLVAVGHLAAAEPRAGRPAGAGGGAGTTAAAAAEIAKASSSPVNSEGGRGEEVEEVTTTEAAAAAAEALGAGAAVGSFSRPAWCVTIPNAWKNEACRGSNPGGCSCHGWCYNAPSFTWGVNVECCACGRRSTREAPAPLEGEDGAEVQQAFENFTRTYNRMYHGEAEHTARFQTFRRSFAFIKEENTKNHTYKLRLTEQADIPTGSLGLNPRLILGARPQHRLGSRQSGGRGGRGGVPSSVDWQLKGTLTAVQQQGSCGSCYAFASTAALAAAWKLATGTSVVLSQQQIMDCTLGFGNAGCGGGAPDAVYQYAMGSSLCSASSYGYRGQVGTCQASACDVAIPRGHVVGYQDVQPEEAALMEAVAQQPVSVAIYVDPNQYGWQLYSHGVFMDSSCSSTTTVNHAVLLVGYGVENGWKYWLIQNSWGTSWGIQGYMKLLRGAGGSNGYCGILMAPSYPIVQAQAASAPAEPAAGGGSFYGEAPCIEGELYARVSNSPPSEICSPQCTAQGLCPSAPQGQAAVPACVLEDSSQASYCALVCQEDSECPSGATCIGMQGIQICAYQVVSRVAFAPALTLQAPGEPGEPGRKLAAVADLPQPKQLGPLVI